MGQRRGIRFNNSNRLLVTDDDRLSELRTRVEGLASDLAELEAMSVSERREAADLRSDVLQRFKRLGRV